ncbi:Transmembrane secretion effector [Goodfellowiella coeruleoviolacea]|uniref:Transmembrane secretion effector n=1 Tax=Goodfellowiella coeruleoviolacea TaxID=334858 RepID=A0AAE3GCV2_9PSEU|nr:Transmembrane secretion effector [Goodfellowiella coeruleoviolacea]
MASAAADGLMVTVLPLVALSVTADPVGVSLVTVARDLPWVLLSLFVGVLLDRVRRLAVLVGALVAQLLAATVLAVLAGGQQLSLAALVVVAFVVGSGQVVSEGATGALLPDVVGADRLNSANARLMVIDQGLVRFVVPPLTGVLLAWWVGLPAWVAVLANLVALAFTRVLTVPAPTARPGRFHPLRDIREGLVYLVNSQLLRAITLSVAISSFAWQVGMATFVLYGTRLLGLDSTGYGLLLGGMSVGWLLSSVVAGRLIGRFGYAAVMRASLLVGISTMALLAVVPPWWQLIALILVVQAGSTLLWNVSSQTSRQRFTPPELLGRVLTSHRALSWGLLPVGALVSGLVAAHWGLRAVWVVAALVEAVGLVLVWRAISPARFVAAEQARHAAGAGQSGGATTTATPPAPEAD